MILPETFYIVCLSAILLVGSYYVILVRTRSITLVESMSHAAVDLMKSIQDLEDKIEGINVVNQSQIRALETSLESAKKRANAAESKLAAIYQQNPELKRRRS